MDHTALPSACENCEAPLHGRYCHACGQSAVNPLKHAGHALEEFFESFWHLDGRAFCTLRDLLHPGRVALAYIKGHRARYIPPLRMFLVLSVLTFFLAKLLVSDAPSPGDTRSHDSGKTESHQSYKQAKTAADVQRVLDAQLAEIRTARESTRNMPFMSRAMDEAERKTRAEADARLAQLRGAKTVATAVPATAPVADAPVPADRKPAPAPPIASPDTAADARTEARTAAKADKGVNVRINGANWGETVRDMNREFSLGELRDPKRVWNEHDNPITIASWPAFANRWLNHKFALAGRNAERFQEDPPLFLQHALGAAPTALFVLVPVFALLLKLLYIRSGRGYLEHLVVGLYSHAFLLMAIALLLVLAAMRAALPQRGSIEAVINLSMIALWIWMPIYLLLMQKRVYAQGWLKTVIKYVSLGIIYQFLLVGVLLYAVFSSLVAS